MSTQLQKTIIIIPIVCVFLLIARYRSLLITENTQKLKYQVHTTHGQPSVNSLAVTKTTFPELHHKNTVTIRTIHRQTATLTPSEIARKSSTTNLSSNNKNNSYIVPNKAHYVWFTQKPKELEYYHLLSLLSAHRIMKADEIFFYYNTEPVGKYWEEAKRKIPNLILKQRKPSSSLFGVKLKKPSFDTSASDVERLHLMQECGGVYLDMDILITQPLDPLRIYLTTLGYEMPGLVCGGFIMAAPHAPFIYLWLNNMLDDYKVDKWAYISGILPSRLISRYKSTGIIHIEPKRIHYPNWQHLAKLIGPEHYDWSKNYAVHLWHRLWERNEHWKEWKIDPDPESIKTMNNTFGQIARMIYYGSKEII